MAEMVVSASEFRVKMKDIGNAVAEEQHRVVVTRHGGPVFVVVSQEDHEFLLRHKPAPTPHPVPDPVEPRPEDRVVEHPARMTTEDIELVYEATHESTDFDVMSWRWKAYYALRDRGRSPKMKPFASVTERNSS